MIKIKFASLLHSTKRLNPIERIIISLAVIGVVGTAGAFVAHYYQLNNKAVSTFPTPSPFNELSTTVPQVVQVATGCQYADLTPSNILNAINDYRKTKGLDSIVTEPVLTQFANAEVKPSGVALNIPNFFDWAASRNTGYAEEKFDRAGGSESILSATDSCQLVSRIAQTTSGSDFLTGPVTQAVGIGINDGNVLLINGHYGRNENNPQIVLPIPTIAPVPTDNYVAPTFAPFVPPVVATLPP